MDGDKDMSEAKGTCRSCGFVGEFITIRSHEMAGHSTMHASNPHEEKRHRGAVDLWACPLCGTVIIEQTERGMGKHKPRGEHETD